MSKNYYKTFQRSLVLFGGLFLIFQSFKVLRSLAGSETQAIREVITKTKYRNLYPFIVAQAKHETNNYQSSLAINFNNLFGMKNAIYRPQLGISIPSSDYRRFSTKDESVRDFVLYLDYVNFPSGITSIESYVYTLKSLGYFEDTYSNYLAGLKRYYA